MVISCTTEQKQQSESDSVLFKDHDHGLPLLSSGTVVGLFVGRWPTMVWLLTAAKGAIMRNPTGAVLLSMLCVHIFGYFMMR